MSSQTTQALEKRLSLHERCDYNVARLTDIIGLSNFVLASCVIKKSEMPGADTSDNPYNIALKYCLETLYDFVREKGQQKLQTHIVVEQRGKKEDGDLELEFLRICDGENKYQKDFPFKIRMASKAANSAGLQLADLVARPIGRHILDPSQQNRAFDVLQKKFYCAGGRAAVGSDYVGYGLKCFP